MIFVQRIALRFFSRRRKVKIVLYLMSSDDIYCFDIGHKAVSSEMPLPRMEIFGLEGASHKSQSEEHLVIEYKDHKNLNIGDLFYAIPYHICPTVAKYNKSYAVINGEIQSLWDIQARDYQLSI